MKIKTNHQPAGSALIVTLCTATIIGTALGSYLVLVSNQNLSVARSFVWNSAMPVLESGVEEALTQIHYNGCSNLSANAWTLGTDGLYHKKRALGSDGSYYEVTIQPVDPPVIVSTGYVPPPPSQPGMVLGNVVSGSTSNPSYVFRTVRVTTRKPRSGGAGLTAKDKIAFSGGGSFDSFDSSDPNYSTGGQYDLAKRKAGGKALSNAKVEDAIHVDSTHIYGSVVTGPGGTVSINSGAVGDLAWNSSHSGIETGYSADDANVDFFDEKVPFSSGYATPGNATVGGTNYTYVVGPGNNKLGTINVNTSKAMIVTGGDAVLFVDGDFVTSGSGYVYVAPGASLKLFVSGRIAVSGTGIVNGTSRADKLSVHGLNTCSTVNYSGSSAFIGTVNAPYAAFSFSGLAGAFGSFVANTISISGGASVHYDEALNTDGPGYVVASWNEI